MAVKISGGELFNELLEHSKKISKRIVFSDGDDIRLAEALDFFQDVNDSSFILLGNEQKILSNIKQAGIKNTDRFTIINPAKSPKLEDYKSIIRDSFKARNKDISDEKLNKNVLNTSYWTSVMLKTDEADCAIGGSISTTADLVRGVINVLGLVPGKKFLSGAAFVDVPDCSYGINGKFCVADPAIIPKPGEDQLLDMALSSYDTAKSVFEDEPRVAMLSYSTRGSADGEEIEKIRNVVDRIRKMRPEVIIDGEIQFDAAIVPEVFAIKAPNSVLEGKANVLIFPELNAANIGYKIIQRLGKAEVCGTVVQGAAKPFNDLSRGCLVQDIISLTAMTLLQAKGMQQ
ncbi:MAG: phosphate acetyltransferase [Actinobacteria bacterium]|nr:phosphate acetyltransferase [Actinomycetota bacterium]